MYLFYHLEVALAPTPSLFDQIWSLVNMNKLSYILPLVNAWLISYFDGPFFSHQHNKSSEFNGSHRLQEETWEVLMETSPKTLQHEDPLGRTWHQFGGMVTWLTLSCVASLTKSLIPWFPLGPWTT